jgi:hypothetical protein
MVTLRTMEFLPIISTRPTLMPKPPDKLPSMLKKLLMPGEMDGLQIPDQFFP